MGALVTTYFSSSFRIYWINLGPLKYYVCTIGIILNLSPPLPSKIGFDLSKCSIQLRFWRPSRNCSNVIPKWFLWRFASKQIEPLKSFYFPSKSWVISNVMDGAFVWFKALQNLLKVKKIVSTFIIRLAASTRGVRKVMTKCE